MIEPFNAVLDATSWQSPEDGDLTTWLAVHTGQTVRINTGRAGATIITGTLVFAGELSLMVGAGASETFVVMPISDVVEVALYDAARAEA